jgi:hypothetical protein
MSTKFFRFLLVIVSLLMIGLAACQPTTEQMRSTVEAVDATATAQAEAASEGEAVEVTRVVYVTVEAPKGQTVAMTGGNFDSGDAVMNSEGYRGPLTREAQEAVGISLVRVGTEASAWTWRGLPHTEMATCPSGGWLCTLHLENDDIVVVEGNGEQYTIVAGTFRFVAAYPAGDAVWDSCDLLEKEQKFGVIEDPSFQVRSGNFSCSGDQPEPAATATRTPTENGSATATPVPPVTSGQCPTTSEEAAELIGGNADSWSTKEEWNGNGWLYGGPVVKLTTPHFGRIDIDGGTLRDGQSAEVSVGTFWCEG